mgnify:FL=1
MHPSLPDIHAERKQRKQQHRTIQRIERGIDFKHPSHGAQNVIQNAERKARQHRHCQLRELERNVNVHPSKMVLPEAARGRFVLVAQLAYAALDAKLSDVEAYPAYMQPGAAHDEVALACVHDDRVFVKALYILDAGDVELRSVFHAYAVRLCRRLLFFLV